VGVAFEFTWDAEPGRVRVECAPNEDPATLGSPPEAQGFPVCTAMVEFPPRGYRALFGWVQLVRSTDNSSGGERFELDPFALFGDAPSPYSWYGTAPTLFDAPLRLRGAATTWVAHSFLATTPLDEVMRGSARFVVPLVGFSWGFDIVDDQVTVRPVTRLTGEDWNGHLPVLRESYPYWRFREATADL
jgi:hypothetical protein